MGLDLAICPQPNFYPNGTPNQYFLGYTRLDFDRHYDLFGLIGTTGRSEMKPLCNPQPFPSDRTFMWYEDEGVKDTRENPYGDPLTMVMAGELGNLVGKLPDDVIGGWNLGILKMMQCLHPDTPVVLWWH